MNTSMIELMDNGGDAEAYILEYLCAAMENANTNSENGFEDTEAFIREHLSDALDYAKDAVGGGWKGSEKVLLETFSPSALRYARDVLGRRWPEGEEIIRSDNFTAYEYARTVIKGRWHEAEDIILQNLTTAVYYARDVIGGRWKELEKCLKESASDHGINLKEINFLIDLYAREVLWEDWSSCQDIICDHPNWLYSYFNSLGGKAPLPENLHNMMLLYYLEDAENSYVRYYFRDLGQTLPT